MINLISLYSFAFIVTVTPGPNNLLSMTYSSEIGYKKTHQFRLGIYIGFTIIMFSTAFFNMLLLEVLPSILMYFKYIGALYIFYLILKINNIVKSNTKENQANPYSFKEGLLLQIVNPKVILYGISIFSSYIILHTSSYFLLSIFSISFSTLAFVCINIWSLIGDKLQSLIDNYRKVFQFIMSVGLLYSILTILDIM